MIGTALWLETVTLGSETSVSALAGDVALTVVDVSDFLTPTGGLFDIGKDLVPLPFTSATLNDDGTGTLTVPDGLPDNVAAGVSVDVWDVDGPSTVFRVGVVRPDGQETVATIRHSLLLHLSGLLDLGVQPAVEMSDTDDGLRIVDIQYHAPSLDLSGANPDLPVTPGAIVQSYVQFPDEHAGSVSPASLADGLMPATITVTGGLMAGPMQVDAQGFHVVAADGSAAVTAPQDGRVPRWSGEVDAARLVTSGGGQLGGTTTTPVGSAQVLRSTLDGPAVSPSGQLSWQSGDLGSPAGSSTPGYPTNRIGLGIKSTSEAFMALVTQRQKARLVKFGPGSLSVSPGVQFSGQPTVGTIASLTYSQLVSKVATLEFDPLASVWYVRYWDPTTAVYSSQWAVTQLGRNLSPLPAFAMLGFGGQEFTRIARSNTDGTVTFYQYTDHVYTSPVTTVEAFDWGGGPGPADLKGHGFDGDVSVITGPRNLVRPPPATPTGPGAYPGRPIMPIIEIGGFFGTPGTTLGDGVVAGGDSIAAGIGCLDGDTAQRTWYLSGLTNEFASHTNWFEAGHYWAKCSYSDGTHQTKCGPSMRIDKIPGSIVTLRSAVPPPGSSIVQANVYLAKEITVGVDPPDTSYFLQFAALPGFTRAIFAVTSSGSANPPAVSTFPVGTVAAGAWQSETGGVVIRGDGTGYLGNLLTSVSGGSAWGTRVVGGTAASTGPNIYLGGTASAAGPALLNAGGAT